MFEPQTFLYSVDAERGVATLTLDRPDRLNALTFGVYEELRRAFYALHDEDAVRVIVLTGSAVERLALLLLEYGPKAPALRRFQ